MAIDALRKLRRSEYEAEIDDWRSTLNRALLKIENRNRVAQKLPKYPKNTPVLFPFGPNARLALLTLKVWCIRYCITAEFLIEELLRIYGFIRKPGIGPERNSIVFGLSASLVTGVAARKRIEDAVKATYPNGENFKMQLIPMPKFPILRNFETLLEMKQEYDASIEKAQNRYQKQLKQRLNPTIGLRNYRRSADGK